MTWAGNKLLTLGLLGDTKNKIIAPFIIPSWFYTKDKVQ
jgi:hypothetical protein